MPGALGGYPTALLLLGFKVAVLGCRGNQNLLGGNLAMRSHDALAVQAIMHQEMAGQAREYAAAMGISYSNLMNKLNPHIQKDRLSFRDLWRWLQVHRARTGQPSMVLAYLAGANGGVFTALLWPQARIEDAVQRLGLVTAHQTGLLLRALYDVTAEDSDGGPAITAAEVPMVRAAVRQVVETAQRIDVALSTQAEWPQGERRRA